MADVGNALVFDPAKLTFESIWTRRKIVASYWIAILLATPLWWKTTSIDRLSLPGSRVRSLGSRELLFPVDIAIATPAAHSRLSTDLLTSLQPALSEQGLSVTVDVDETIPSTGPGKYRISSRLHESKWVLQDRELCTGDLATLPANQLSDVLMRLLTPYTSWSSSEAHRVVKYSPRLRLAFTLLNEDASSGAAAISWELENSVQNYLNVTLDRFLVLHNFTIESQVQFHAPLAFQPRTLDVDGQTVHGLTQEDLTVFVNSAEWTLSSSVSNDPVLHFVLFIPSAEHSPLYILDQNGVLTSSDAFILPQWGGIVLLNNPPYHLTTSMLHNPFSTFRHQLLSLLGVPGLPPGVEYDGSEPFSDWQLDALVRHRAQENFVNSRETLNSIVALVKQIDNMPVGRDVRDDVQGALTALNNALATARSSSMTALKYSSEALTLSSRAFFNPGMLALLYFPAEHKYAVYAPLFAAVVAPLVAAILREVMVWRKARREAAAATAATTRGTQPAQRQRVD